MIRTFLLLALAIISTGATAQTRDLSGLITLDTDVALKDYRLRITVNNHIIVVSPPSFTITRPITSKEFVDVTLPEGENTVSYLVNNIRLDPDEDYSLEIECLNCAELVPKQCYSPDGNKLCEGFLIFIQPEDLPDRLDLVAVSNARISGKVDLGEAAQRELEFTLSVVSNRSSSRIYQTGPNVTLSQGTAITTYEIIGLRRDIGADQFRVQLECNNCFGQSARAQLFPAALSPLENHSDINFRVTDQEAVPLAPVIDLLLAEP